MKRKNVGKVAFDLLNKTDVYDKSVTVIDQQRESQKDYIKELVAAAERGKRRWPSDFYIHVETKAEPLMPNTLRHYFIDKGACPTPFYDQSVFRYNSAVEQIEYLWTIPDKDTCGHLLMHALEVVPEERELLNFCMQYQDGTLLRLAKKLNKEK